MSTQADGWHTAKNLQAQDYWSMKLAGYLTVTVSRLRQRCKLDIGVFLPFAMGRKISATLTKGTRPLTLNFDRTCWQPSSAIRLDQMLSLEPCERPPVAAIPRW
ncbi:hypothetical protein ACNKHO_22715 [Shigella flexneri]